MAPRTSQQNTSLVDQTPQVAHLGISTPKVRPTDDWSSDVLRSAHGYESRQSCALRNDIIAQ
jgi:hypothetical protein